MRDLVYKSPAGEHEIKALSKTFAAKDVRPPHIYVNLPGQDHSYTKGHASDMPCTRTHTAPEDIPGSHSCVHCTHDLLATMMSLDGDKHNDVVPRMMAHDMR